MSGDLRSVLQQGIDELSLDLSTHQVDALMEFMGLLQKWNKVYNLTAVRDPQEMMTHHLLDSLAAVPALQQYLTAQAADQPRRLLDVGSGGGLPGVVFAICCPDLDVSCVDTVGKKAAFIQQAAATLRLNNLHGIHSRVEELRAEFPIISCRAFASLRDFTSWSSSSLMPDGVWMAMKGKEPAEEVAALDPEVSVFHVEQLQVPGLSAERCLVWMRKNAG